MASRDKPAGKHVSRWLLVCLMVAGVFVLAEAAAETVMRVRAAQQFPGGYCGFQRVLVPSMIEQLMQQPGAGRFGYARLTAGEQSYLWSFNTFSFEPEAVSCRDRRAGWCWCLTTS
jgi:hypothetical protein